MSGAVGKVSKPQLRGLLQANIKKNLIVAVAIAAVASFAQKFIVNEPRKTLYKNFYEKYDIDKEFNIMRNKGLFDSCEPDN